MKNQVKVYLDKIELKKSFKKLADHIKRNLDEIADHV